MIFQFAKRFSLPEGLGAKSSRVDPCESHPSFFAIGFFCRVRFPPEKNIPVISHWTAIFKYIYIYNIYIYIYKKCYTYILWHDDRVISRKSPICGVACCMAARVLPVADMKCGSSEVNAENVRNAVFKTSHAWEQTSQTRLLWPGGIPMFWHLFLKQFFLGDPTHLTHGKVMIQVHYIVLIGDIPIRTYSYGLWKSPWYTL